MERQARPLPSIAEASIVHDTALWYVAYTYPRHEKGCVQSGSGAGPTEGISAPGAIHMLSYRGTLVAVSDTEIDAIRRCVGSGAKLEPHAYIALGAEYACVKVCSKS